MRICSCKYVVFDAIGKYNHPTRYNSRQIVETDKTQSTPQQGAKDFKYSLPKFITISKAEIVRSCFESSRVSLKATRKQGAQKRAKTYRRGFVVHLQALHCSLKL